MQTGLRASKMAFWSMLAAGFTHLRGTFPVRSVPRKPEGWI